MIVDFSKIDKLLKELDHKNLNNIFQTNPTAENIAKYVHDKIDTCYKVKVIESEGNEVFYESK